jgi:hypothetical protein
MVVNVNGMDKFGRAYMTQAMAIAHTLQLFNGNVEVKNRKERDARGFTAWALFNFQRYLCHTTYRLLSDSLNSALCYHFWDPPLIAHPPNFPLPMPPTNHEWYPQMWLKYSMNPTLIPTLFGVLFKATVDFRVILNDIGLRVFGSDVSEPKFSKEETMIFYSRLSEWYQSLPEPLTPKHIAFPQQFQLQ